MRAIAFLQPGWADWEAGFVLGFLRDHLGAEVAVATPDGKPQTSIGGLTVQADLAFGDVSPTEADIFLVIGSDEWPGFRDEVLFGLLRDILAADKVLGLICAATIAGVRSGIFQGRSHTSNSRKWLAYHVGDYPGSDRYVDSVKAVTDGRLVTAPGSAPGTFAAAILRLAAPDRPEVADQTAAEMAAEWVG